jgi:DNA-binding CsgD family transcriptional regulator
VGGEKNDRHVGPTLAKTTDSGAGRGPVVSGSEIGQDDSRVSHPARDHCLDDRLQVELEEKLDEQGTLVRVVRDDYCFLHARMRTHGCVVVKVSKSERLRQGYRPLVLAPRLTAGQAQLIALVARGLATKQIAAELGVSERAITARLSRLFRAYGTSNRAGLIAAALSQAGVGLETVERPDWQGGGVRPDVAETMEAYASAPFMVSVTRGPDHIYSFVNAVAARVAGRDDLIGKAVIDAYPELDATFREALDRVYRTGEPWSVAGAPARFTHPDGSYRDTTLNLMFQPIRGRDGAVEGILHIGTEIED